MKERSLHQMIPVGQLSQREFTRRLRSLVDFVQDPENRYLEPERFAESYSRIVKLAALYPDYFEKKYIVHNLGKNRIGYIEQLMGED